VCLFCAGSTLLFGLGAALSGAPIAVRVIWLAASIGVVCLYCFRLRLVGVMIDDQHVTIVNVLRTSVVAVRDVDRFEVGRGSFFPRIGLVVLRDGSRVGIWAIQSVWNPLIRPNDPSVLNVVDDLNRALRVDRAA
jgi:hypothetical protein